MLVNESPTIVPDNMIETPIKQTDIGDTFGMSNNTFVKTETASDKNYAPNKLLVLDKTADRYKTDGKNHATKQTKIHQALNDDVAALRSSYNVSINNVNINNMTETDSVHKALFRSTTLMFDSDFHRQNTDDISGLYDASLVKTEAVEETGIT